MPPARTDLNTFATDLAVLLPGHWNHAYHGRIAHEDQNLTAEQLWDAGHVSWVVNEFALSRCSILNTLEGQRLLVIDRPRHPHQFVVAPLVPDEDHLKTHHFDGVDEPNGITVSNDPRRAADKVERRLLPRHERALQAVRRNAAEEPEPPHRPAPPPVAQVVTLTWYADGALGTAYASVPKEARMTLYAHGFQYHPRQAALLLPEAYGEDGRALRIQSVARRLAEQGIGVNLRHAAPTTTAVLPPSLPTAVHSHHR